MGRMVLDIYNESGDNSIFVFFMFIWKVGSLLTIFSLFKFEPVILKKKKMGRSRFQTAPEKPKRR